MTTRYVGAGGNDGNNGTSWATRKLTLNGVEDTPVAAGDTVYVGPGTYRELLTVDVSGSAGSPITYIGDYTGANTDGVGGVVRITGSDNDQTAVRANAIAISSAKNYRTFSGFLIDTTSWYAIAGQGTNWIINGCSFAGPFGIQVTGSTQAEWAIGNCHFWTGRSSYAVLFSHSATLDNCAHVVSNCTYAGGNGAYFVVTQRVGGITVRNCTIYGGNRQIWVQNSPAAGQTLTVNNCLLIYGEMALYGNAVTEIIEDYNNIYGAGTARVNTNTGVNSLAYPPLFDSRWFFQLVTAAAASQVITPFDLASYSQLVNVAGTSPTATDMRGQGAIGGVREWGSLEYDSSLKIAGGSGGAVSISPYRGGIG